MAILCCLPSLTAVGIQLDEREKNQLYSSTHKQKRTKAKEKPHSEWKAGFLLCKCYAPMNQFPV